jgi:hypothetical protein
MGQPVDGDPATCMQLMPQLVDWVERGEAPGTVTLSVTAQTVRERLIELHVAVRPDAASSAERRARQRLPLCPRE